MTSVLIVDDDRDIREAIRLALEEEGYTIAEAADGANALDKLRHLPERWVVVLDHVMPILNGTGFLRAVQADPVLTRQHAYILLTARTRLSSPVRELAAALGVPILNKPFELDHLLRLVAQSAACLEKDPGPS
jgi:CheY-like chemotaxis protein